MEDKKVYATKVEVFDKKTKESVKKSLFFKSENGKVSQVAEHDFDFDVNSLLPGNKNLSGFTTILPSVAIKLSIIKKNLILMRTRMVTFILKVSITSANTFLKYMEI